MENCKEKENNVQPTTHKIIIGDAVEEIKKIPDGSIQLIVLDPPYNLNLAKWDDFENYLEWARLWLDQIHRMLTPEGNCVIFGGSQFQDLKKGDLLEVMHYVRHSTDLRLVNKLIWHYKNGASAYRFFASRYEEIPWYTKSDKYYFNLDAVREPYDEETKKLYKKDKRLKIETIEKGKNPTNVWDIGRLNGNSKERVGHPTQKPKKVIQRIVMSLSPPGSTVLDFFAGSGTTGRVCIEEGRNSILIDKDPALADFLDLHIQKISKQAPPYQIIQKK